LSLLLLLLLLLLCCVVMRLFCWPRQMFGSPDKRFICLGPAAGFSDHYGELRALACGLYGSLWYRRSVVQQHALAQSDAAMGAGIATLHCA
jgi:hypothetical protein